jgi:hypothetical protein
MSFPKQNTYINSDPPISLKTIIQLTKQLSPNQRSQKTVPQLYFITQEPAPQY